MRTKGAVTYGEQAETKLLSLVTDIPKSTLKLTKSLKEFYPKIHNTTVKRILEVLKKNGLVRGVVIGRTSIWFRGGFK